MTEYVGGIRARLIKDSMFYLVKNTLTELGWFDTSRQTHLPIQIRQDQVSSNVEIPLNTLVLVPEHQREDPAEMGSSMAEFRWTMYWDFYAESDAIGLHMIHDIKDILGGRMPSLGRSHAVLPVYDYQMATPVVVFSCDIEDLLDDRAIDFPKPWMEHWHTLRAVVIDAYSGA